MYFLKRTRNNIEFLSQVARLSLLRTTLGQNRCCTQRRRSSAASRLRAATAINFAIAAIIIINF